jgi:hypothetical protein
MEHSCKCGLRQEGAFLVDGNCPRHGRPEVERNRVNEGYYPTPIGRAAWERDRGKYEKKKRDA